MLKSDNSFTFFQILYFSLLFCSVDTVRDGYGDLSYADTYRGGSYSDTNIRVAPGSTGKTYAWKEQGFTHCSASCLGGIDFHNNSIINNGNINLKTVLNVNT